MIQDVTIANNQVVVSLSGNIYVEEAAALRENLLQHIGQGYKRFLIDLSHVSYIDSSGLGVLVAIQKRALQHDGGVILKGLHGVVKELFELTRLHKVFEIRQ